MTQVPFPTSSTPGQYPSEGQGQLLNCYMQKDGDNITWRRVPGLQRFANLLKSGPRGMLQIGPLLYVVVDGKVLTVSSSGDVVELSGTLNGTGPVTIARNNRQDGPDIIIVDAAEGPFSVSGSTVSAFVDADLPVPSSVSFLDGYLLFTIGNGQIWATGLNDATIDGASVATAEARPDGLLRGVAYSGLFYACGTETIEVWQNAGTSPFPLARQTVIKCGLLTGFAIAGDEAGWNGPLIFAAADGTVRLLDGAKPVSISTADVERSIASISDKSTIRASVYTYRGHMIWSLSSPQWTWEYNVSTSKWHQRRSYGLNRWRVQLTGYAFNKWVAADSQSQWLFQISEAARKEDESPLVASISSATVLGFPNRATFPSIDLRMVVGIGIESGSYPIETDPSVFISWSDDGGATFGVPVQRSFGRQGKYEQRVRVKRTGLMSRNGRVWKVDVSDPVDFVLMGGDMTGVPRGD